MGIESQPNLMNIHRSFAGTDLGQTLADQVRYDRYKPEAVSNERWVQLLGADVNNLTHMPLTWGLTMSFVSRINAQQPDLLNTHEGQVLQAAALIHDWAEAIVGDITFSEKTSEQETEEHSQLIAILEQFSGETTQDIWGLVDEAAHSVVFSHEGKLGHMFNTIERVGYLRTALRASQHVRAGSAPDCENGLMWIVADVFGNQPITLMDRAADYEPVSDYLRHQSEAIAQAFDIVHPDIFSCYPVQQQAPKYEAFYAAQIAWAEWSTNFPAA